MKKILIADADQDIARSLGETLTQQGFETLQISDPHRALEMTEESNFDLILLDSEWHSDSEIAYVITEQILQKPGSPSEIILMSQREELPLYECYQAGASHVLKKPLNVNALMDVIGRVQAKSDARRFDRVELSETALGLVYGQVSKGPDTKPYIIEVSNIGRGGFSFKLPPDAEILPIGQILAFEIKLGMVPNYHIGGQGIVRWARPCPDGFGTGIEFLSIAKEFELMIQACVDLFKIRVYLPTDL